MSTTVQTWYNFVLQQMAAESYLDDWKTLRQDARIARLNLGSNNQNYLKVGQTSTTADLPGATRMTEHQATDFQTRYTIVSHLPNTASGFSATLMQDNVTGAYTLSMRSTEYFNENQGGDWARDGLTLGADLEIARYGFAFGQIASMETYYDHLKLGESYNTSTGQWESDATLNDFKNRFGGSQVGGTLNVTGSAFPAVWPMHSNCCIPKSARPSSSIPREWALSLRVACKRWSAICASN